MYVEKRLAYVKGTCKSLMKLTPSFLEESQFKSVYFFDRSEEEKYLIYNEIPVFTGQASIDFTMSQSYLFP